MSADRGLLRLTLGLVADAQRTDDGAATLRAIALLPRDDQREVAAAAVCLLAEALNREQRDALPAVQYIASLWAALDATEAEEAG